MTPPDDDLEIEILGTPRQVPKGRRRRKRRMTLETLQEIEAFLDRVLTCPTGLELSFADAAALRRFCVRINEFRRIQREVFDATMDPDAVNPYSLIVLRIFSEPGDYRIRVYNGQPPPERITGIRDLSTGEQISIDEVFPGNPNTKANED